jgi:predicted enzyme related to lactoylglutathione lyase
MAGEIVHIEFVAEDADRAQRFWNGLFGWEFGDSGMPEMDYRMAQTGEGSGAAIYAGENPGHPKYYFDTGDIDASSARVRELGGSADDKTPVPGHGWFTACKDS